MWKPRAMTSPRRANSPSSASAGGQEEHPCEVNNSTTVRRVSAFAGDPAKSSPRHNSEAEYAPRRNANAASPSQTDPQDRNRPRRPRELPDHNCVRRPVLTLDKSGDQAVDLAGFFHVRQVAGRVEDVHRHSVGERLGLDDWDDMVVTA